MAGFPLQLLCACVAGLLAAAEVDDTSILLQRQAPHPKHKRHQLIKDPHLRPFRPPPLQIPFQPPPVPKAAVTDAIKEVKAMIREDAENVKSFYNKRKGEINEKLLEARDRTLKAWEGVQKKIDRLHRTNRQKKRLLSQFLPH
mmetsp:Transcript_17156/g.40310  ORF Transcript_17156/g.40310 Transcript_17156/m.40310 type:complete len:143 (-) Transcript_17156:106-534(-)